MEMKPGLFSRFTFAVVYVLLFIGCSIKAPTSEQKNTTPGRQESQISVTSAPTNAVSPIASLEFQEAMCSQEHVPLCWVGIEIGVTSYSEAETVLRQHYGKQNVEAKSNSITWISDGTDISRGGGLAFSNGIVDRVRVWFGRDRLTVENLIEVIGQPELVRVAKALSSDISCAGVSLFYPNLGIEVWLSPEGSLAGVKQSQFIDSVMFLSPRLLKNWQITDSFLIEWDGYRNYCSEPFDTPFEK
jgi:hypothetical protein